MPLYDFVVMASMKVDRRSITDLLVRVGQRVYAQNGVITDVKSFGKLNLAYHIMKRDGRHYEGQMMQMTFMAHPQFNKELSYLNKDERILRWMLVKHRGSKWLESIRAPDSGEGLF
ncbi:hypothetical protein O6H91_16G063400 [Diphasiastrum complanatum]|uniref:Uncharacterized protein n=2 Tax=Diphasiastrum complanatum TaxID=34168 RepID=A0ACC2BCV3_DIPCM|nr:hypothetical protein O6H91_16G063400 [Diphasiastrum complanatum]